MNPLVTIGIPTLGRIEYLLQALAAAKAQSYAPLEILVGDNSTDEAMQPKIAAACDGMAGLRILRQSKRLSMADHWNALADEARGSLFCILADDDFLEADFVRELVALREGTPSIGVCFSDHRIMDGEGRTDPVASDFYSRENGRTGLAIGEVPDAASAVWRGSVPICSSLMETALVRKHRFRGDLNTPEIEFFARLALAGVRFAYSPKRLARYRVHASSETQAIGLRNDRLIRALREVPAPESAEGNRRFFMGNLLVTGVTQAFRTGDMKAAREFLGDPLYPRRGRPVAMLQRFSARFPDGLAPRIFRVLHRLLRPLAGKHPLSQ